MRRRSKILVGAVVVASGLGAWVFLSSGSRDMLSSRWAVESGLPELPPAEDNGWFILTAEGGSFLLSDEPEGVAEALTAISDQGRSVDERWQVLVDVRTDIMRMLGRSSSKADLERWHAASDALAFADGCSLEVGEQCGYFVGFELHRLAQLEIVGHALSGDWHAANEQLAAALRMDHRYLASGRSVMGVIVASENAEHDLGLAHILLARQQPDAAGRDALLAATSGLDLESDTWMRSVVGGYTYERNVLEWVQEHGPGAVIGDGWWPPHFLYEPHETVEMLARVHHEVLSGSDSEAVWSLRDRVANPVGCALVDPESIHSSFARRHEELEESLTTSKRWQREILERWGEGVDAKPLEAGP